MSIRIREYVVRDIPRIGIASARLLTSSRQIMEGLPAPMLGRAATKDILPFSTTLAALKKPGPHSPISTKANSVSDSSPAIPVLPQTTRIHVSGLVERHGRDAG